MEKTNLKLVASIVLLNFEFYFGYAVKFFYGKFKNEVRHVINQNPTLDNDHVVSVHVCPSFIQPAATI